MTHPGCRTGEIKSEKVGFPSPSFPSHLTASSHKDCYGDRCLMSLRLDQGLCSAVSASGVSYSPGTIYLQAGNRGTRVPGLSLSSLRKSKEIKA